jgi:hypothetical protein
LRGWTIRSRSRLPQAKGYEYDVTVAVRGLAEPA